MLNCSYYMYVYIYVNPCKKYKKNKIFYTCRQYFVKRVYFINSTRVSLSISFHLIVFPKKPEQQHHVATQTLHMLFHMILHIHTHKFVMASTNHLKISIKNKNMRHYTNPFTKSTPHLNVFFIYISNKNKKVVKV